MTLLNCKICTELAQYRTQVVPGQGNTRAHIMFVGEAPGRNEDKEGKPFVGRAGNLLNQMLAGINIKREDVYVTNVVKCRPPNNRTPTPRECANCHPWLEQEIALIQPKLVVCLGATAMKYFLPKASSISQMRGKVLVVPERAFRMIVTFHPAAVLRDPRRMDDYGKDFALIGQELQSC